MSANITSVDAESLRKDIRNLVRKTVEETLNALLDEEASELVVAERYERTAGREAYPAASTPESSSPGPGRSSSACRNSAARPYKRPSRALSQARDLGRGGHRRDVPRGRLHQEDRGRLRAPLGGSGVLRHRLNLNERAFASIEAWRQRPLDGGYPYVFVDGIHLRRSWGGSYENVAVLVTIGANSAGDREVIGCSEGYTESAGSWLELFSRLRGRGLSGARLVAGDKCAGMLGAFEEVFPGARYQRCTVHFYRNVLGRVPVTRRKAVASMLKAIHA